MTFATIQKSSGNNQALGPYGFIEEMDRMFDDFLGFRRGEDSPLSRWAWNPAVDICETQEAYVLKAELPGLKKDEVKITLANNVLSIAGEKKSETTSEKSKIHRVERVTGAFQRSFSLPMAVKGDKIEASYKDGVLEITVPKSDESKPREIEVKLN